MKVGVTVRYLAQAEQKSAKHSMNGYECRKLKGSSSRWRCMVTLHSTCNCSLAPPTTSLLGTDSSPQSPTACLFLLSDFLLSVAAPSLSLELVCGTIYRRTLPPHRRWHI